MTDALPERQKRRHSGAGTLPVTQRVPRPGESRATHPGGTLSWGARSGRGAPRTRCRPQSPGSRSGGAKGAGPRPTPPPRSPEPRHQLSGARRPKRSGCGMRLRRAPVEPQKGKFGESKKKKVLGGKRSRKSERGRGRDRVGTHAADQGASPQTGPHGGAGRRARGTGLGSRIRWDSRRLAGPTPSPSPPRPRPTCRSRSSLSGDARGLLRLTWDRCWRQTLPKEVEMGKSPTTMGDSPNRL